jgi:phage tail-like protein
MGLIDENVSSLTVANMAESGFAKSGALAARAAGALTTAYTAYVTRTWEKKSGMRFDPAPAYLYYVELSGVLVALFTKCKGLGVTRDVETVTEGGVNNYEHKLPGRLTFGNITLEHGLTIGRGLWDWMMQGRYRCRARRINFSIIQGAPGHNAMTTVVGAGVSDETYTQGEAFENFLTAFGQGFGKVKHWDVENAFPVNWSLADLDSSSAEASIESIEIAHHGVSLSYEVLTPMSLTSSASGFIE